MCLHNTQPGKRSKGEWGEGRERVTTEHVLLEEKISVRNTSLHSLEGKKRETQTLSHDSKLITQSDRMEQREEYLNSK